MQSVFVKICNSREVTLKSSLASVGFRAKPLAKQLCSLHLQDFSAGYSSQAPLRKGAPHAARAQSQPPTNSFECPHCDQLFAASYATDELTPKLPENHWVSYRSDKNAGWNLDSGLPRK
jgi:hypothetical protein